MFEWDPVKSEANHKKRGFRFDLAEDFDFSSAVIQEDTRKDYGETRYRAFGRIDGVAYAIAFTPRGKNLRIISMRRMHDKEADRYGI